MSGNTNEKPSRKKTVARITTDKKPKAKPKTKPKVNKKPKNK